MAGKNFPDLCPTYGGQDTREREDICVVKGQVCGTGRHRCQSKGQVQLCSKLAELERADKESIKRARDFFAWSAKDVR